MLKTGFKVGGNYLKYYTDKALNNNPSKEQLNEANANDIYKALSHLKGSALKAAQMISMDHNLLPPAFAEKFREAQYKAPPLSYPLVRRTFVRSIGKRPEDIFETFSKEAVNAASIGQVHKGTIRDQVFAVKVQYPGVADSVEQDLNMALPLAARLMQVKVSDLKKYTEEVKERMIEETDYDLELKRSMDLTEQCAQVPGLLFPKYYPEYSGNRVITMDWIDGIHLSEWIETNPSQESRNQIGQALWDFYHYQIHTLKKLHADPHPGNFLVTPGNELAVLDFGCVKEIPEGFYNLFVQLLDASIFENPTRLIDLYHQLDFISDNDGDADMQYFMKILNEAIGLLIRPFQSDQFDFAGDEFFDSIYGMADQLMKDPTLRKGNAARGPQHAIYINRTYFGLYSLLHQLGAKVNTGMVVLV